MSVEPELMVVAEAVAKELGLAAPAFCGKGAFKETYRVEGKDRKPVALKLVDRAKIDFAGGGQLPYWFEHGLIAFLREADIARLRKRGLGDFIGVGESNNNFANQILEQFVNEPAKPWLRLSWRQYLAWFAAVEKHLSEPGRDALLTSWLREAEKRWEQMEDAEVLLEESRNDGRWLRSWRQALSDFRQLSI
jgi:hypothetical protein